MSPNFLNLFMKKLTRERVVVTAVTRPARSEPVPQLCDRKRALNRAPLATRLGKRRPGERFLFPIQDSCWGFRDHQSAPVNKGIRASRFSLRLQRWNAHLVRYALEHKLIA